MAALLLLAACGKSGKDKDTGAAPPPSTTTTVAAAPAGSPPPPAAPPANSRSPKCTPTNQAPPSGFTRTDDPPTDFDGDGKPDAIYQGTLELFIAPSSGRGARLTVPSPKPALRLAGVDPDGDGDQEMFVILVVGEERRLQVATFADCAVRFATNQQGEPYQFKVGDQQGSGNGVGCTDADGDGRSELVGLHYERQANTVRWTRTIVQLRDGRATNGKTDGGTYVSPQDDARIELLRSATCGERSDFLGN